MYDFVGGGVKVLVDYGGIRGRVVVVVALVRGDRTPYIWYCQREGSARPRWVQSALLGGVKRDRRASGAA